MRSLAHLALTCGAALVLALAGCSARAAEMRRLTLDDDELAESAATDAGGWQSAPWSDAKWIAFPGQTAIQIEHALGRKPDSVLVYLSFVGDDRADHGGGRAHELPRRRRHRPLLRADQFVDHDREHDGSGLLPAHRPQMTLPRRYELDAKAELGALRLRGVAGLIAFGAGAWLLTLPQTLPRLFALAGCAFGALWIARWKRGVTPASEAYLELREDALVHLAAGRLDVVPWREVREIGVDEDLLVVRVERTDGASLLIEPRYGLGLYALCDEVRLVWRRVLE